MLKLSKNQTLGVDKLDTKNNYYKTAINLTKWVSCGKIRGELSPKKQKFLN